MSQTSPTKPLERAKPAQPRNPASQAKAASQIRGMFNKVSGRYDFLNHFLSLNLDRRWRRAAAKELSGGPTDTVLDLCCGTGDLSIEVHAAEQPQVVLCCDFSHGMLQHADRKFRARDLDNCLIVEADGLRLPLPDESVDAVTIAFGVRNFTDLDAGLKEVRRVLRPGGRLVVLEFSHPTVPLLSGLYRFYLSRILPRLGDAVSGNDGPYGYLARTISEFPDQPALAGRIRDNGYAACGWKNLTGGIVAVHTAYR